MYKEQHRINELQAVFQKTINQTWQFWKTVLKKKANELAQFNNLISKCTL